MSQVPTSPPPSMPPAPGPTRGSIPSYRPLGRGSWIALGTSVVVGLVYTGVLGTFLALGVGTAFDAAPQDIPTAAPGDPTDDPFGSGDPSDPLYDYPGYQDGDAELVLGQASAEKVRQTSEVAVAAVEAALLSGWTSADDEYYEQSENAYGGPSLFYDYVSATEYAAGDVTTGTDKQEAVDHFTAALAPLGFDEIDVARTPAQWSEQGYELEGNLSAEEASATLWIVTARSSIDKVPAIELGLADLDADKSGRVTSMLEDFGLSPDPQGAFLAGYANGLLAEGDRDEFIDRMKEYGGVRTS